MKSLRKQVFWHVENHPGCSLKQTLSAFRNENKDTVKRYYYIKIAEMNSDVIGDITLESLDTIKEMEKTIQLIKDPVKRAENLARLHNMKLKPIKNKDEKSLTELFNEL
jgi:hypothetical protein